MTAAILSMLPRRKGRQVSDGREILKLFPAQSRYILHRDFIYAIAFDGGVVKLGKTASPNRRLAQHWARSKGQVQWIHLFESCHPTTARMVEARIPGCLSSLGGRQINGSEWFFSTASKTEVIATVRPLIATVKDELTRRWAKEDEVTRLRNEAVEFLSRSGLLKQWVRP